MANEVSGIDILLYIDVASVRTLVGGQRGVTIRHTTEIADAKHKSSGAWQNRKQTFLDWAFSGDVVIIGGDATRAELRSKWRNRQNIEVEIQYPPVAPATSGIREYGTAVIADISDAAPHDNIATMTLDLQGNGPLNEGTWS